MTSEKRDATVSARRAAGREACEGAAESTSQP